MSGQADTVDVVVIDHPKGCLVAITHDGGCITLNRAEAMDLLQQLNSKIGRMPVKV